MDSLYRNKIGLPYQKSVRIPRHRRKMAINAAALFPLPVHWFLHEDQAGQSTCQGEDMRNYVHFLSVFIPLFSSLSFAPSDSSYLPLLLPLPNSPGTFFLQVSWSLSYLLFASILVSVIPPFCKYPGLCHTSSSPPRPQDPMQLVESCLHYSPLDIRMIPFSTPEGYCFVTILTFYGPLVI
jgi:hypothetical protein